MDDIPTGIVTFLLSDIAGSTHLWEAHPTRMNAALRAHDRILREAVEQHDGMVVKHTGDGICAAFSRATSAARAALDVQRDLDAEPWPESTELDVRLVLHTGECYERDHDYFGSPLCLASRLVELARPGVVWATQLTATLIAAADPDTFAIEPIGVRTLRGVSIPVTVYELTRADPATRRELRRILPALTGKSRFGRRGVGVGPSSTAAEHPEAGGSATRTPTPGGHASTSALQGGG